MTPEQLAIKNVGKQDPKRHMEEKVRMSLPLTAFLLLDHVMSWSCMKSKEFSYLPFVL